MKPIFKVMLTAVALVFSSTGWAASYIVMANGNTLPGNLERAVQQAGGTISATIPEIGIAVVESDHDGFSESLESVRGVRSVTQDVNIRWLDPVRTVEAIPVSPEMFSNPPTSGDDDFFFDLQWGHDAVDAVEAWNKGFRGAGVRVAVLDSGIDAEHPDIAPNLNLALSTSFVPGEDVNVRPGPFFNHGTHVAGTVAAADNAFGTIGVAPEAELVAVKVLSEFTGSGTFAGVIQGIVYAASIQSDIINMSLGAAIPRNCTFETDDGPVHFPAVACQELLTAVQRAINFAVQNGTTVIASAGNSSIDAESDKSLIHVPSELANVIAISATGPLGWAVDPATNLDVPSFFTNFGQSHIDFAAPGGNVDFDLLASGLSCTVVLTRPCWVFDLVFSTSSESWFWAAGTSMASPHASGVAAIIIGANGGDMHPHQVESALKQSADDLGKPGKDDFFGNGRVNADNAL